MFAAKLPLFRSVFEFANRFPTPSTPRRRRFAPVVWVRCGEPTLPRGTIQAPNVHIGVAAPIDLLEGDAPSAPTRAAEPPLFGSALELACSSQTALRA